jgi:hypothetical protein
MDTLFSKVSSDEFKNNLIGVMNRLDISFPTDTFVLRCETCLDNVPMSINGILQLKTKLDTCINNAVLNEMEMVKENHKLQGCESLIFHHGFGIPDILLISFPASESMFINDITISNIQFKLELVVKQESGQQIIFALYHKDGVSDKTLHDLITMNFDTFLNVDESSDKLYEDTELVFDDDSVHEHQQELSRVYGGGRRIMAAYNYECLWCSTEFIENGKGGRFLEIKNYRDHFRKKHDGVPMSEFIEKVNRREPKWFCKNCKRRVALANMVRHKAVCYDIDTDDEQVENDRRKTQPKKSGKRKDYKSKIFDEDWTDDESIAHRSGLPPRRIDSSSDEEESHTYAAGRDKTIAGPKRMDQGENSDDFVKAKHNKKKSRIENTTQCVFLEPDDEIYISSPEGSPLNNDLDIKVEVKQEDTQAGPSAMCNNLFETSKWWLRMPDENVVAIEDGGPIIFHKEDSSSFIKYAMENWKKHILIKKELDQKMMEAESEDARSKLFSLTRDKPFLTRYIDFVRSFSAKDMLGIFSEDYPILDIPKGAKSTTAQQYGNRIIEFFKFMASKYVEFHLDWMLDFNGCIEKTYPNGSHTKEMCLPTMEDLREFIQSFKYGINPAANCGLRIFALKKMLEFIKQEVKDNEHAFDGTLTDKNRIVESLVQKIDRLNEGICPDGTIKHLATASNKSHKRSLVEQMAKCPTRNMESIMKGVGEYVQSDEYNIQRTKLIELACKKIKLPTSQEYMNSTNWLLEQLVCLGGNRPCALLGITLRDWAERKPGFCPFSPEEENETFQEDPDNDARKVLKDPYQKPKGEKADAPTGFIVNSETDKIAVSANQPCYIWFPNAIADLINDHSLMAQKILPKSVDIYHPKTRLFLNSLGNPITRLECKHFKKYIGLPITAYDFRRSLSTFCLDSDIEAIRNAESSILRHREETGFAYYYQKHGEKVEYVSIQYAKKHGLIKASVQLVDKYCLTLRNEALNDGWDLTQKRTDRAIEYQQSILEKRKQGLQNARQKGDRNWILPKEYDDFLAGIKEAMKREKQLMSDSKNPGPFRNILKYEPGQKEAGLFPPTKVWQVDMFRVLYGLDGEIGEMMRKSELSVYNGVPFSSGLNGRKKIVNELSALDKRRGPVDKTEDWIVANYWREKIRRQTSKMYAGKWAQLEFIFNVDEFNYHQKMNTQ